MRKGGRTKLRLGTSYYEDSGAMIPRIASSVSRSEIECEGNIGLRFCRFVFPFLEGYQRGIYQNRMTAHNVCPFHLSIRPNNDFHFHRSREVHLPSDLRV